jgi:hypothetical protein
MNKWIAKLACKYFGHKGLDFKPTFQNPKKGDAITRTWDCPRCYEGTLKTYVWKPEQ